MEDGRADATTGRDLGRETEAGWGFFEAVVILEDAPKILLKDVRALPEWPALRALRAAGGGELVIALGDQKLKLRFDLVDEDAGWRVRTWFRCACGSRRRSLYVDVAGRRALCAACLGARYFRHALPDSQFRDLAREVLRTTRRARLAQAFSVS